MCTCSDKHLILCSGSSHEDTQEQKQTQSSIYTHPYLEVVGVLAQAAEYAPATAPRRPPCYSPGVLHLRVSRQAQCVVGYMGRALCQGWDLSSQANLSSILGGKF